MIVSRLVQLPVILFVVFALTFVMTWLLPGNPIENPERPLPPAIAEAVLRQYNLHDPWIFAYEYLKGVTTQLDFGPSLTYRNQRVSEILSSGLPVSGMIGAAGLAIALVVGTLAGMVGALKPGSAWDTASLGIALIGVSVPSFVTASVLLLVFAGLWPILPASGWGGPEHLILPALALSLMPAAYIARLIRLGLADVMSSDFVRTARAKGVGPTRVLIKHAMKVAFLPVLSFLGPAAAYAVTGSFVVEQVFNLPGMGEHFVNAVRNGDQFLVLGTVLVFATILVVFNLLVDVAYAWLDPRIELG